jgi:uncharacterized protein (TIGR02145 family)
MKKIFILLVLSGSFLACKKETKTPNTNNTNTTDSTKTSSNSFDTTKYVTNGIVSIGKPIGKIGSGVTDIDGNTYKTVVIGTQEWMGENLKTSKYNDGTVIPNVTDDTQWSKLTTGAWCNYNNNETNNTKYGKLYNWYAVSQTTNGNKNICPTGWHVSTDAEWSILIDYLGGDSIAGGKMKELGNTNWKDNNASTNSSLFTALPGGHRQENGIFIAINEYPFWWTISQINIENAIDRYLVPYDNKIYRNDNNKVSGFYLRCLKD